MTTVTMLNAPCDRCGREIAELHPYKLSEFITYRAKVIRHPWLCITCFKVEKRKWWEARDGA